MVLITQAISEGSGEPVHLRSLARAFAVRTHEVWKLTKGPTKNQTSSPAHVCLKNEFTENEKNHNLMSWLTYNPSLKYKQNDLFRTDIHCNTCNAQSIKQRKQNTAKQLI